MNQKKIVLPLTIPLRILYFVLSYLIICVGIALSNRCKLPIIPTDLFPREVADIMGLGVGTIVAAFTMGKGIAIVGNRIDRKVSFVSVLQPECVEAGETKKD